MISWSQEVFEIEHVPRRERMKGEGKKRKVGKGRGSDEGVDRRLGGAGRRRWGEVEGGGWEGRLEGGTEREVGSGAGEREGRSGC